MDARLAEFIGIMLGDGHFPKDRLKISLNSLDEKEYLEYISDLIVELFKTKPIVKYRKDENTVDLFVFKKRVLDYLEKVGLIHSPKWKRATIPTSFLFYELDVLRGYFDTDGCVVMTHNNGTLYPRLEMKICPSPMQKQFIQILNKYSFNFGAYSIGKGEVRIQMNGKRQLAKWISLVGFHNQKHLKKAMRFV